MSTAFLTDQYEITMLEAALKNGTAHKKAVFELFTRKLPKGRGYGVVAGTQRALEAVKNFTFTDEQINYLRNKNIVDEETLTYLKNYKFTGTITGYREGDLYFPYSPILTVKGTFGDAVLIETVLLSILNHDSAVASAASRMVVQGQGTPILEMGSRRTHEHAAVESSRAAYIAGFVGTSNLEAGMKYNIPTIGTSAHAFTLAHDTEKEAFRAQIDALGTSTTLLVDTYNIEQGIRNAVEIGGTNLGGIRIDSGDLVEETIKARKLLDELGAKNTKIVLSSDIDEYTINALMEAEAPVGSIGAGTKVVTGSGHPTAGMVYKLVAIENDKGNMRTVAKKAEGKISIGGEKTVQRKIRNGKIVAEIIIPGEDTKYAHTDNHTPVLTTLMNNGEIVHKPDLEGIRRYNKLMVESLPEEYKQLEVTQPALSVYATEDGEK